MKHSLVWMMTALTLMASNALAYTNPHILDVDLSIEGVEDRYEVSPGGFVAKDGLKKITLRYTGVNLPTKTRLNWDSAKIKVDGLPDGTDEIYWDPASMMPTQLWVRGVAASATGPDGTNGGPEHLCLEAINNGTGYVTPLFDRIAFTVYEVTNIIVIPKGMTTNDTLPDPVTIGAGAMDSEAHQADVTIQITPPISGVPVDVSLLDGRGHDAGKDAKLVMGGAATAIGGGAAVTVLTGAGGQIQGVLTSSDVEDGLACKIHAGLIDRPVQFTWDRYREAAQWTNVQEYLPFPGVLTNYVVLRHHRKPAACTPTNPAPYRPFIDHEIHFFVKQVEYWDTNGVLCVTNNTPPVSGGLSAFAAFVQEAYTTDGGGQVVPLLQVYTNYDISSVTMVGYDYSVWDTAAVSGAGAGGSGGTAGSLQEGGGGSGGLTPQQASPTAGHSSISSTDDVPKVEIEKCASAFLPQGGANDNTTTIRAFVTPSTAKGKFQFTLFGVSDEKGYCLNAPTNPPASGEDSDAWKDFQFPAQTGFTVSGSDSNIAETVQNDLNEATVTITSFDYGSYGKIKAEFTTQDGSLTCIAKEVGGTEEYTRLPADTNANYIADSWSGDVGPGGGSSPTDDTDNVPAGKIGDGFTRYEEWRGFMVAGSHIRTSVTKRDLFVYDEDSIGIGYYSSGSGIEVHSINIDEWSGTGKSADGKRIININRETATCTSQHGLWLLDGGGPPDQFGWAYYDTGVTTDGPPINIWKCTVDRGRIVAAISLLPDSGWEQMYVDRTIAHELGHGSSLSHHNPDSRGGNLCVMRYPPAGGPTRASTGVDFCTAVDNCLNKIHVKDP